MSLENGHSHARMNAMTKSRQRKRAEQRKIAKAIPRSGGSSQASALLAQETPSGLTVMQVVRIIRIVEDYLEMHFSHFHGIACTQTATLVKEALRIEGHASKAYMGKMAILEAYASTTSNPMASWTGHFDKESEHAWVMLGSELIDITTPTLADQPTLGFPILDIPYLWYDTESGGTGAFYYKQYIEIELAESDKGMLVDFNMFYDQYEQDPSQMLAPRSTIIWNNNSFHAQAAKPHTWASIVSAYKDKHGEVYPAGVSALFYADPT